MIVLTLEEIKANSRFDSTVDEDLLTQLGETAESMVENILNRSYDDLYSVYGKIPYPVKQACLALVEHLYRYPGPSESVALYDVPWTIDAMVKPYIVL